MNKTELTQYAAELRLMSRHQNELTSNRLNWMILLQGILFTSSASLWKIHWVLFLVLGLFGIYSCMTFAYVLWLTYDARRRIRSLWIQKVSQYPEETKDIPPVTTGAGANFQSNLLLPWLSLPWAIIVVWITIIIIGLIFKHGNAS